MNNISIAIKTFERKKALWRLLLSIRKYYPLLSIIIVDDSKKNYKTQTMQKFKDLRINYIVTEFDIGLSKGRNILLKNVETKYFLLCDDDFEFDEKTDLKTALTLLQKEEIDLLGGTIFNVFRLDTLYSFLWAVKRPKRFIDIFRANELVSVYNGTFSINGNNVKLMIDKDYANFSKSSLYNTDIVSNFFIASTDKIKSIKGWQPENIKVGEHQAFFLRLKLQNIKVCYTPLFGVKHYPQKTISYNKYRMRSYKMIRESFRSLGIETYKVINKNNREIFTFDRNE